MFAIAGGAPQKNPTVPPRGRVAEIAKSDSPASAEGVGRLKSPVVRQRKTPGVPAACAAAKSPIVFWHPRGRRAIIAGSPDPNPTVPPRARGRN